MLHKYSPNLTPDHGTQKLPMSTRRRTSAVKRLCYLILCPDRGTKYDLRLTAERCAQQWGLANIDNAFCAHSQFFTLIIGTLNALCLVLFLFAAKSTQSPGQPCGTVDGCDCIVGLCIEGFCEGEAQQ